MPSLKKNIVYSSILTSANYIFPFLTYPYVSRVLGVTNIGICNFIDSIINYFILFSMMGIGVIGVREIARCKDVQERSKVFSGLLALNTISTTIILVILIVAIYAVPKLCEYKELMYIGALKLVCNYLLVEWLYKGLEDFKFITIRTIIIKVAYVISVFIFIRNADDYPVYYLLLTLMVVVNAMVNILYARKFVTFTLKGLTIRPFIKSFLILGGYMLLTSMYTSFNVTYLGFVSGETEVGYYTTATKLYSILLALYTAFTSVLMPRMSALVTNGEWEKFRVLLKKSIHILLALSMPLIIFAVIMSPQIIELISGDGYEGAIIPMRITMPLMLVIGFEQILIIQTLMPLKGDKIILRNSILGALIGISMNVLLVKELQSIGSACVWVISELTILISAQWFLSKKYNMHFPFRLVCARILQNFPLAVLLFVFSKIPWHSFVLLVVTLGITFVYSFILQFYIIKDEMFLVQYRNIIRRLTHKQI